jgi:hypothetical protein
MVVSQVRMWQLSRGLTAGYLSGCHITIFQAIEKELG